MYRHLSIINPVIFFRKITKNHKYALALAFSMDEINRNPDLLPNISLIIKHNFGHCDGKSVNYSFLSKNYKPVPNYFWNKGTMWSFLFTGPHWKFSFELPILMDMFLSPRVSFPRPGILNLMSLWVILIYIKKVNGWDWIYSYINLRNKFKRTY